MKQRLWFIAALIAILFSVYTVRTHGQTGGALHPYIYGSRVANGDLKLDSTLNSTKGDVLINPGGGAVGVGTTSPAAGLHGVVTSGAFLWAQSEADDADKTGVWGVEHYDVDEEPFYGIWHYAQATTNTLNLGGGQAIGNAATRIRFHTAADSTTTTGTERAKIDSSGYFYFTDRLVDLGDTNTYIASSGSDQFNIFTGGSEKARVDSSGYFYFTERLVDLTDQNTYISTATNDQFNFYTGGQSRFAITTTGLIFTAGANGVNLYTNDHFMQMLEMGTPSAPTGNNVIIYAVDNGGKTELCARFATGGACIPIAIEP